VGLPEIGPPAAGRHPANPSAASPKGRCSIDKGVSRWLAAIEAHGRAAPAREVGKIAAAASVSANVRRRSGRGWRLGQLRLVPWERRREQRRARHSSAQRDMAVGSHGEMLAAAALARCRRPRAKARPVCCQAATSNACPRQLADRHAPVDRERRPLPKAGRPIISLVPARAGGSRPAVPMRRCRAPSSTGSPRIERRADPRQRRVRNAECRRRRHDQVNGPWRVPTCP